MIFLVRVLVLYPEIILQSVAEFSYVFLLSYGKIRETFFLMKEFGFNI